MSHVNSEAVKNNMSSIDRLKMCKRYFIIVVDGISDMNDISTYHQFVLIFFSLARESQLYLTIGLFEVVCLNKCRYLSSSTFRGFFSLSEFHLSY